MSVRYGTGPYIIASVCLEIRGCGGPVINAVKEEFECAVRLGTERDLRAEKKEFAFAHVRFHNSHSSFEIMLPPGPSAAQRLVSCEPSYWSRFGKHGLGHEMKDGAPVEIYIQFIWQSIGQRVCIVNFDPKD